MFIDEVRKLSNQEIADKLDDAYDQLLKLRFQKNVGDMKDTNVSYYVRKDIARMKTILRERELEAQRGTTK